MTHDVPELTRETAEKIVNNATSVITILTTLEHEIGSMDLRPEVKSCR
jgi:hypothetical protein